jgi:hypothetical protein
MSINKVKVYGTKEKWYESRRIWGVGFVLTGATCFALGELGLFNSSVQATLLLTLELLGGTLGIVSFKYPKN